MYIGDNEHFYFISELQINKYKSRFTLGSNNYSGRYVQQRDNLFTGCGG